MVKDISLKAETRTEQGSGAARRLRRAGFVPAAMNCADGQIKLLKFNAHDFEMVLRSHTGTHLLLDVAIGSEVKHALLREIQFDVIDGTPIHADFGEISLSKKIRLSITIRLTGRPEGVRTEGGVLQQTLREIEVECLPKDIVENFEVDVTALKVGQALSVGNLNLGEQFTILTHKDVSVATVVLTSDDEAVAAAPVEGEAAAPEVISKGKKDEAAAVAADSKGDKKK